MNPEPARRRRVSPLRLVALGLLLAIVATPSGAQLHDEGELRFAGPAGPGSRWEGPTGTVLFDNGPLVNSPGTGVGGADESLIQASTLMMTTLGFGFQVSQQARLSDQLVVPPGQVWQLDRITFFGYQVGLTTVSTFTALNYQIWDGPPYLARSRVVFGDPTTNRLLSSTWTGIYRVRESDTGRAADRAIMANVCAAGVLLPAGTYYLDFQADGTLPAGPFAPPVTIAGTAETGDGLQTNDGGASWEEIVDGGSEAPQGLPFVVEGLALSAFEVPALSTGALAGLAGLLGAVGCLYLARRR